MNRHLLENQVFRPGEETRQLQPEVHKNYLGLLRVILFIFVIISSCIYMPFLWVRVQSSTIAIVLMLPDYKLRIYKEPGIYFAPHRSVTKFKKADTYVFNPEVAFNNGSRAIINGTIRYSIRISELEDNPEWITKQFPDPSLEFACYTNIAKVAASMSCFESIGEKRNKLLGGIISSLYADSSKIFRYINIDEVCLNGVSYDAQIMALINRMSALKLMTQMQMN